MNHSTISKTIIVFAATFGLPVAGLAQGEMVVDFGGGEPGGYIKLLLLFASLSLAPAVLAVTTSFARIVVVLFFLRAGLGASEIPPTVVLIGLAIFLTVFTMAPQLNGIYGQAVTPYLAGDIEAGDAISNIEGPLREYMTARTRQADIDVFTAIRPSEADRPAVTTLVPAFVLSELRAAFLIGLIIYLPFFVIDVVVGATIASVGLLGLPVPALSLPFKVLLFVMVDGWALLAGSLLGSMA
ncbi:MAG: flagellar type III secretion system pore protein FliP [Armatimonadota bacterium]